MCGNAKIARHNHLTYALLVAPCACGPGTRTSTTEHALADSSISCCRVVLNSLTCIDQHTASCPVLMPLKPSPCRIRKTMADRTVTDAASTATDGSAMSLWSSVLEPKELPQHTRK